jgi:hypothetical protein
MRTGRAQTSNGLEGTNSNKLHRGQCAIDQACKSNFVLQIMAWWDQIVPEPWALDSFSFAGQRADGRSKRATLSAASQRVSWAADSVCLL